MCTTIEVIEALKIIGVLILFFALLFSASNISEINKKFEKNNKELEEIKKLLAEKQKQDELDTDKK